MPSTKLTYSRVHTLPVYENVEALQILPSFHYYYNDADGAISKNELILASAGSAGVVKIFKTVRKQNNDEIISTVTGLKLLMKQDESSAFGDERGGYTGLLLSSHKQNLNRLVHDESESSLEQLIAVDAEHNITFLKTSNMATDDETHMLGSKRTIIGHNDEILDLKIIPENNNDDEEERRVAVATNSAQVRIFQLGTFSCEVLDGHTDTVLCLDVSPCGRYLSTSGKDQTMRIWHLKTGKCIAIATGHTEAVGASGFSKKIGRFDVSGKAAKNGGGSFVVTASKDKTLKRWNLPGSSIFDKIGTSQNDAEELHVFVSTRAHEKVSLYL